MSDDIPIARTEILEERGNRDAFRLACGLLVVLALFLAGLLWVLSRVTVISLTLPERAPTKRVQHAFLVFRGMDPANIGPGHRTLTGGVNSAARQEGDAR